jgi:gliding motility-associated lipoprotein GldD
MKYSHLHYLAVFILALLTQSCGENAVPRPYGYFRVNLPTPEYRMVDSLPVPYAFEVSSQAKLKFHEEENEKFWVDLEYPQLHATVYCSYKPVNGNLLELTEDARKFVYKHTVRADGIGEKTFEAPDRKVYGVLYDLKGNTASSLQFLITDSTTHFFRGALYFDNVPNKDSIAPMAQYIREDVIRLMESFEWRKR